MQKTLQIGKSDKTDSKSVTIDLNGYKLDGSATGDAILVNNRIVANGGPYTLTVKDSDGSGEIISGSESGVKVSAHATQGKAKFILEGGNIKKGTAAASNAKFKALIYNATGNDGSIGEVEINGGYVEEGKDYGRYVSSGTEYLLLDGKLYAGTTYTQNTSEDIRNAKTLYANHSVTLDSVVQYFSTSELYTAALAQVTNPLFKIGNDKFFTSFENAVKGAQSGDTITLCKGYECSESDVSINKDITLDLNGNILTTADNIFATVRKGVAFSLINSNTSDPQAGGFSYGKTSNGSVIYIESGADFSASDVKITGTNSAANTFLNVKFDTATEEVGGVYKATNTGKITLTNVTATIANGFFVNMATPEGYYASGYDVEVTGGDYTSSYTDANGVVFALAGAKANFKNAKVTTNSAVGVVLDDARYDTPSTAEQKEAAASTPTAVFENCEFTVNGTANGGNTPTALIAVAGGNVAQIKGGTYTLGESSSGVGGLQVYSSNGGFIVDSGTFENNSTDTTTTSEMFRFNATDAGYAEDFGYINSGDPVAVVKSGTFKGTLTSTAKTSSTDTEATHAGSLKVMGGTYKNSDDSASTEVNSYTAAGLAADSESGTIGLRTGTGWTQDTTTTTTYHYVLAGATEAENVTLLSAMGVSDTPAAPANNCFFVLPMTATYAWGDGVDTLGYYLAKYTEDGTSATLQAETAGVSVEEATDYLVTSTITDLTISGTRGINVDASGTNLALTKITGGDGGDTLKAGARATTLDGGAGDDKLIGNDAADTFIYSGGKDTIDGFGDNDKVTLATGFNPITDGSKISGNATAFTLTFNASNSLTFTGTTPATLQSGDDTYSYTKDYVEKGSYATLAAGATYFDMGTVANSVDASAVTVNIAITDNSGNNYIIGGQSANTFNITGGGKDTIVGYDSLDAVNVSTAPPTDLENGVSYADGDFVISLGANDSLTVKNSATVKLTNDANTYYYEKDRVIVNDRRVTLGSAYSSRTFTAGDDITSIDASAVTVANGLNITGNENAANSIIGAASGGTITGGDYNDTLQATGGTRINGGYGDDLLIGSTGTDIFIFTGGADSIQGYAGQDLVSVSSDIKPADATFSVSGSNISLDFGGGDKLTFMGIEDAKISLQSGRNTYIYTEKYYAQSGKGITLAEGFTGTFDGTDAEFSGYATIDAEAVSTAISIMGNSLNNDIIAVAGGSLYGGAGNDLLDVTSRASTANFLFQYTEGKDTVDGFASGDKLDIDAASITAIKTGNDKLTLSFEKSNALILKGDDLEKISLNSGGFFTKDGIVDTDKNTFKLFGSAKGLIDLKEDALYSISGGITSVNAAAATKPITLVGGTVDAAYTFATNKKKDLFEYNGGNVTIRGYESGTDKINLGDDASISGFAVDGENVSLNVGNKTISLVGAAGQEVLIHDANSRRNSYSQMVFHSDGVILNKEKRPTEATLSANFSVPDSLSSIKKIFVTDGAENISITAGNKNKTTLDVSAAGTGVTLIGGSKNDKLIGSTVEGAVNTFVYGEGKDAIQNFSDGDNISLTGSLQDSLSSAKISASKKSLKFKFSGKNVLTIKPAKGDSIGAISFGEGESYTYSKNAIASGNNASLTSNFSGSYKLENFGVNNVYGGDVKKNMTFKGTEAAETLTGGTKKTNFKGGGGNDSLVGGSGKDVFFYAKNDTGNVTIADFGFDEDKLKIASNTITTIAASDNDITFTMKNGSLKIESSATYTNGQKADYDFTPNKTLIKANSTYYWFAEKDGEDINGNSFNVGALITSDTKVKKGDASGFEVIDLGYSTNLVKTNVAVKVANAKPNQT